MWQWYWIGGQYTVNKYVAKLLEIKSKLLDRNGEAAYLAVFTEYDEPATVSSARLQGFLDALRSLEDSLTSTRAGLRE